MSIKRIYLIASFLGLGVIRSPVSNNLTECTIAAYAEVTEHLKHGLPVLLTHHFTDPRERELLSKWFTVSEINVESSKVGPFRMQYNNHSVTIICGLGFPGSPHISLTGIKIQSDRPWSEAELCALLQDGYALSAQVQCGLKHADDVEEEFRRKHHITSMQNFCEHFSSGYVGGYDQSAFLQDFFRSAPNPNPMDYRKDLFRGSVGLGLFLDVIKARDKYYACVEGSLFIEIDDPLREFVVGRKFHASKLQGSSKDFTIYSLLNHPMPCPPPCLDVSMCEIYIVNLNGNITIQPPVPTPTPIAIQKYWQKKYGSTRAVQKHIKLTDEPQQYQSAKYSALGSLMQAFGRLNAQPFAKYMLMAHDPCGPYDPTSRISNVFQRFGSMFVGMMSDGFHCVDLGAVKVIMLNEDLLMYVLHDNKVSVLHITPATPVNFYGPDSDLRHALKTILRCAIDVKKRSPDLLDVTNPDALKPDVAENGYQLKDVFMTKRIPLKNLKPLDKDFTLKSHESPIEAMASILFAEPQSSLQALYDDAMGNIFYGSGPVRCAKPDDGTYFLKVSEHVVFEINPSQSDDYNIAEFETIQLADGMFFDAQRFFTEMDEMSGSELPYHLRIIFVQGDQALSFKHREGKFRFTGDMDDLESCEMSFPVEISDGIPMGSAGMSQFERSDAGTWTKWDDVFKTEDVRD